MLSFYDSQISILCCGICILACLFRRKSQTIVIARSSLMLSCKNFNVAYYPKSTLGVNTKLRMLAHHGKMQFQDMGHNSEICSFGVMPLINWEILLNLLIKYDNWKTIKDINMKLWILAHHDKEQLLAIDCGHYSESNTFGVIPIF